MFYAVTLPSVSDDGGELLPRLLLALASFNASSRFTLLSVVSLVLALFKFTTHVDPDLELSVAAFALFPLFACACTFAALRPTGVPLAPVFACVFILELLVAFLAALTVMARLLFSCRSLNNLRRVFLSRAAALVDDTLLLRPLVLVVARFLVFWLVVTAAGRLVISRAASISKEVESLRNIATFILFRGTEASRLEVASEISASDMLSRRDPLTDVQVRFPFRGGG